MRRPDALQGRPHQRAVPSFVITTLSPASQLITSLLVVPDFFEKMIAYSVATGKMTLEAAEAAFNVGNYVLISTLFAAGAGIATSELMAGTAEVGASALRLDLRDQAPGLYVLRLRQGKEQATRKLLLQRH